ncbi:hypothetical protein CRE_02444 [Caenorhabditis remanei]|uniref:GIY-YIG domain-containing protein n=1 Tax=Caenorhabditis remanei TaxID=31234 RepID=E3MIS6_CAERE|nr:hypothetical protein CRE_02444 [Caenorhabditis remanei]
MVNSVISFVCLPIAYSMNEDNPDAIPQRSEYDHGAMAIEEPFHIFADNDGYMRVNPIQNSPQLYLFHGYIPPDIAARALQSDKEVRKKFYGSGYGYTSFCYLLLDPRILGSNIETVTFEKFVKSVFYVGKEILSKGFIPPGITARALHSDKEVRQNFYGPGFGYNCFCYMLLDPRILGTNIETVTFEKFVKSVFYVGKGTRTHGISNEEAFVREGSMIEAIKRKNLKNKKGCEFHGSTKSWDMNTKEEFGSYVLHKPLDHFRNARKELSRPPNEQNLTEKYRRIGDLWKAGFRIPKHEIAHGVSNEEAFVREASMIEALQVVNLTNRKIFSPEMNAVIRNGRFSRDSLARALRCENAVRNNFDPRGYMAFCYVLIDLRVSGVNIETLTFETFVKSIFYIGKGSNSRPLQHFIDARNEMDKAPIDQKMNKKLQTIVDIWSSGHGVPKLQFSHGVSDKAALIKEACMIDAVQVKNLTNQKKGEFHGFTRKWDPTTKTEYGAWLLDRAGSTLTIDGFTLIQRNGLPEILRPKKPRKN